MPKERTYLPNDRKNSHSIFVNDKDLSYIVSTIGILSSSVRCEYINKYGLNSNQNKYATVGTLQPIQHSIKVISKNVKSRLL